MVEKIVFLTVCLIPLYIVRGEFGPLPTTLLEVLIALSILIVIIDSFWYKRSPSALLSVFRTPLLVPALLFLTAALVGALVSSNQLQAIGIYRAFFLEPWLFFHVCLYVFKTKPQKIWDALLISGVIVSLPAIFQFISGQPFFADAVHEVSQGRVSSFYNSANAVALYLGPLLGILIGNFFNPIFPGKKVQYLLVTLLFVFTVFLTKSLGAFLGVAAVLLMYLIYYLFSVRNREKYFFNLFSLGAVVLIVSFFLFWLNISLFTPKTGLIYPRPFNSTETVRLCLWEGTRNLLSKLPVTGSGLNNFPESYGQYRTCDTELFQYPHNLILNFWSETTLFGLLTFLYLVFVYYQWLRKSRVDSFLKVTLLAYLVYFFIHGQFDVPYFKNDLSTQFWVYLCLGILLTKTEKITDW